MVSSDVEINPRFYRGKKKRAELQKKKASLMRAERLKNKKNLVYNSSGLATALLKYKEV